MSAEDVKTKIDNLIVSLVERNSREIEIIRRETKDELREFRSDIKKEMSSIRDELKSDIQEFDSKFGALNDKLSSLMVKAAFAFGLMWFVVQLVTNSINSSVGKSITKTAESLLTP